MSVRRSLFATLALTALATAAVTVLLGIVLTARDVRADRLSALRRQADTTAATLEATGAPRRPALRIVVQGIRPAMRQAVRQAVRGPLATRGAGAGTLHAAGRTLLYVRLDTTAGPLALVRPAGRQAGDARPAGATIVLAAGVAVLLAALAAALAAGPLTRPLRALTRATRDVASGGTAQAVGVRGPAELAELADAFAAMGTDLAAARDAERRFLATVSHELRTPLTSIRGYAEALEDGAMSAAEAAPVLDAEGRRLERLVDDLLALARAGSPELAVVRERVDLAALARDAVGRHAAAAVRAGISLDADADRAAPAVADPERLLQAVANLVENALRVVPGGGWVVLRARPGRLEVEDSGPGLAAEDLARAFERFHLHRRYGPDRAGSSGLGLALVAELARAMGGEAHAERAPGGGTRMVLVLAADDAGEGLMT